MNEAKFKIGDRVKLTKYPHTAAEVTEVYASTSHGCMCELTADNGYEFFKHEDELELIPAKTDYSMTVQIDIAKNVVIASLFETEGDTTRPLAKGHGHIIHEGANGVAQAASYACKKLYESLGGTINKGGSWR